METKKYLYAAVGAPVAAAKAAQKGVDDIRSRFSDNVDTLSKDLQKQIDEWVKEGEGLVSRIGDSPAIDELSERVDLDQVQEQVSKLRDQLEDLLATWRNNFRPGSKVEVEVSLTDTGPEVKASATPPPVKSTAQRAAARKTASSGTAAKKPAANKSGTRKPAAQKTATKKTSTAAASTKSSSTRSAGNKSTSTKPSGTRSSGTRSSGTRSSGTTSTSKGTTANRSKPATTGTKPSASKPTVKTS